MELSFFAGLGLGGIGLFFAMKTLQKQEVAKLKRHFSNQQKAYEEQYEQQSKQHESDLLAREKQIQKQIKLLDQQIQNQNQEKLHLLNQLEREQELNLNNQKKLRESNLDIDEILESLEQSQQEILRIKEQEIENFKAQVREYAIDLEQKKAELFTLKQQSPQTNVQNLETDSELTGSRGTLRFNAEQIQELITVLFPDMILLRDSLDTLATQPENLVQLIKALKDITDGQAYSAKKVRATDNKWTECRVPHINLMRLYYQKCKKSLGYQVLISPKKNQKSQDQDYEWLKTHSSC